MKKKVDRDVVALVEHCVKKKERCLFMIVGDKARLQVANLHYLLQRLSDKKPSVLWCYKKSLELSSHQKKRKKLAKKLAMKGLYDEATEDPYELFLRSTDIRYCYYKESHAVLGQTFGMLVLQDFEALTPNVLCRTIETVEGGGVIVFMLGTMSSLDQLYNIAMDAHAKYTTHNFSAAEPRFVRRFVHSLSKAKNCLVVDDELNILPIVSLRLSNESKVGGKKKLAALLQSLDTESPLPELRILRKLASLCVRHGQLKALISLFEFLSKSSNRVHRLNLATLTSARGRGKSATIGLFISGALHLGLRNIVVLAPHLENVATVFQFVIQGLGQLKNVQPLDYVVEKQGNFVSSITIVDRMLKMFVRYHSVGTSSNNNNNSHSTTCTLTRVTQTNTATGVSVSTTKDKDSFAKGQCPDVNLLDIPTDTPAAVSVDFSNCDLLVIEEAAAIPLPLVESLCRSGLVVLSSTIGGYEGTGKALSLKLIQKLKRRCPEDVFEITLKEPIRYSKGDAIESWLSSLLCLDDLPVSKTPGNSQSLLASPGDCNLFMVQRDLLFSFHPKSEKFLASIMTIVSLAHYRNCPDDLLLLCDAPAHLLFVLVSSNASGNASANATDADEDGINNVVAILHVAIEGNIATNIAKHNNASGFQPSGDLIPWTISRAFHCAGDFSQLLGLRILRIAVPPHLQGLGYGSQAILKLMGLVDSYNNNNSNSRVAVDISNSTANNQSSSLTPKSNSLLVNPESCFDTLPCKIDYIGTCFGASAPLTKFWTRLGFRPVYQRQVPNEATGEFSAIFLKCMGSDTSWLDAFCLDFNKRLLNLAGSCFRNLSCTLLLALSTAAMCTFIGNDLNSENHKDDKWQLLITLSDLGRLDLYSQQLADYSTIADLIPAIATLYFQRHIKIQFQFLQQAILFGVGAQQKSATMVSKELSIPSNQTMALLHKTVFKVTKYLNERLASEQRS